MPLVVDKNRCPQNHRCPLISICPQQAISQTGSACLVSIRINVSNAGNVSATVV